MVKRPALHQIRSAQQMRALCSPIRAQIISIMENREEYSVGEIAADLGMQAESVYYHVHALAQAGLLLQAGERFGSTRPKVTYRLLAERVCVDWENTRADYRKALKKATRTAHRLAERLTERAIDDPGCRMNGPDADAWMGQEGVRLGPEKLRELMLKLAEIDRFIIENNVAGDADEETTYMVTVSVLPLLVDS